jgi:hypothetical protein
MANIWTDPQEVKNLKLKRDQAEFILEAITQEDLDSSVDLSDEDYNALIDKLRTLTGGV